MSWWDTGGFSSFASQALKNAQKKIDKVLDIQEKETGAKTHTKIEEVQKAESLEEVTPVTPSGKKSDVIEDDSFFNSWFSTDTLQALTPSKAPGTIKEATVDVDENTWKPSVTGTDGDERLVSEARDSKFETPAMTVPVKSGPLKLGNKKVAKTRQEELTSDAVDKKAAELPENVHEISEETKVAEPFETTVQTVLQESDLVQNESGDNETQKEEPEVDIEAVTSSTDERVDMVEDLDQITGAVTPELTGSSSTCDSGASTIERPADVEEMTSPSVLTENEQDSVQTESYTMEEIPPQLNVSLEPVHNVLPKMPADGENDSQTSEQHSSMELSDVPETVHKEVVTVDQDEKQDDTCSRDVSDSDLTKEQVSPLATSTVSDVDLEVIERSDTGLKSECDMNLSYESTQSSIGGMEKIDSDISLVSQDTVDSLSDSNRTLTSEDSQRNLPTLDSGANTGDFGEATPTVNTEAETLTVDTGAEKPAQTAEVEKTQTAGNDGTLSTSFVKCMLEEAMVESVKDSDSYSSSEIVRVGSGHNSGQTSGDEIDTTTSSDIEIISAPSNGEYRVDRPFDLSPIRQALSKSMVQRRISPPGHRRSDSGSNGEDIVSPDELQKSQIVAALQAGIRPSSTYTFPMADKETAMSPQEQSPTESQRLLKDLTGASIQMQTIMENVESPGVRNNVPQDDVYASASFDYTDPGDFDPEKLAEMSEVLQSREKKLLALSHENMDLVETNNILRNQLKQVEEAREAEMTDLHDLTDEFTKRIAESERKLQSALREKEAMKNQLKLMETEIVKKSQNVATEHMLKEKDEQIAELLKEGEKLSKQQLQNSNIIKKLRSKEKESDSLVKSQKEKLDEQKKELDRLTKILDAKEDIENKQNAAITQLGSAIKRQDSEINGYKSELEDANEKVRSMQVALDNSYKEIAELHKCNVVRASEAQSAALSVEVQAKEELRLSLERQQHQSRREHEAYISQIEDLQLSLSRMEKEHGRREDVLRQEISDLHQRLQEADDRNQDLTQGVSAATRPLLRQIENLQSAHSAQAATYEKVEKNLTERLGEAQRNLAEAVEKERQMSEQMIDMSARQSSLEAQVSSLRQEKSRLSAQLETTKAKLELLEESRNNELARFETMKHDLDASLNETKKEKLLAENQLEMEKMRIEAEKKKLASALEQLHDKEIQVQQLQMTSTMTGSMVASMSTSMMSSMNTSQTLGHTRRGSSNSESSLNTSMNTGQDDVIEKTLMMASSNGNKTSLYESLRQSGAAATIMENLQAQVKQKEGEIAQLQSDIQELEHTREAMARELVNLTTSNDELQSKLQSYPIFQEKYKDLDQRYNALLQMYGEKVEETEELKLDLHDIKDMYKAQIDHLLKQ